MNPSAVRRIFLAAFLSFLTLATGCHRLGSAESNQAEDTSPEKRFKRIMESFNRKIDGQPVGFVVTQGTVRSTMLGTNKVTSEVIKPATPDGHYKAIITVATESHYSLRRTKTAEEAEHEQNAKHQKKNGVADPDGKDAVSILDSDLAGPQKIDAPQSPTKPPAQEEDLVSRRPDGDVRKYELVDDGQHWVLVTKLDPKTEQSIQFAFDEAIKQQ